jgi:hypothetical protein
MRFLLLSAIFLMTGTMAQAVPVIDTATGTTSGLLVTILPDSVDKNLYYFFPTNWGVATSVKSKKPAFSYIEYSTGWFSPPQATVTAAFAAEGAPDLDLKLKEILKDNALAKFTPIPILSARYVPHKNFAKWITNVDCFEKGNTIGQIIGCTWTATVDSGRTFYRVVKGTGIIQVLEYNYVFGAMVNGKYTEISHSAGIYLDGLENGDFWDADGRKM